MQYHFQQKMGVLLSAKRMLIQNVHPVAPFCFLLALKLGSRKLYMSKQKMTFRVDFDYRLSMFTQESFPNPLTIFINFPQFNLLCFLCLYMSPPKLGPTGWAGKESFLILTSFCTCIMAFSSIPRVGQFAFSALSREATTKGHIHVAHVTKAKVHPIITDRILEMNGKVQISQFYVVRIVSTCNLERLKRP